jgi:hypothetical protein
VLYPETCIKDASFRALLTADMTKMSPVLRIKAEISLAAASEKLLSQRAHLRTAPQARSHADTVAVIRKEIDKLVEILTDDASEKHFNVAPRVAKCADYLAQIPSTHVQDARTFMVEAHRVLQDLGEITL